MEPIGIPEKRLSDREIEIMKILWDTELELTANEILDRTGLNWQLASLMTQLSRMEEKGYVTCDKTRRNNLYRPAISQIEYQIAEAEKLLKSLFDSSAAEFVEALSRSGFLSKRELADIADRIKRLQ